MRSLWKGKFITIDYELCQNIEFNNEYLYKAKGLMFKDINELGYFIYRGNRFDYIECDSLKVGFKLTSFIFFSKKLTNIHANNKITRKQRAKKLEMQKKVSIS